MAFVVQPGFEIRDGVVHVASWWAVIFNPSFPYRLAHKLLASTLTAAFLIAGLSAWQLLRNTNVIGASGHSDYGAVLEQFWHTVGPELGATATVLDAASGGEVARARARHPQRPAYFDPMSAFAAMVGTSRGNA